MTTNREKAEALASDIHHRTAAGQGIGHEMTRLVELVPAEDSAEVLARRIAALLDSADLNGDLIMDLRAEVDAVLRPPVAKVILFKASGKYYTEESWRIPAGAIGPYDMERSADFRRIDHGAVLVESQDPWGYPFLFPNE